jgi:hypothetical protein
VLGLIPRVGRVLTGYREGVPTSQSEDILAALKQSAAALRDAGIEFALGGGLAAWARGGPPTEHDIDYLVRPDDTEAALAAFRKCGMRTDLPPEGWLAKAWCDGVLIDLINAPMGMTIDDDFFTRCEEISVAAVSMLVMPLEDVLVGKLLSLNEHNLDLGTPLQWARSLREQIDWRDVEQRTIESPFARTFLFLLGELDVLTIAVPGAAGDG